MHANIRTTATVDHSRILYSQKVLERPAGVWPPYTYMDPAKVTAMWLYTTGMLDDGFNLVQFRAAITQHGDMTCLPNHLTLISSWKRIIIIILYNYDL